MPKSHKKIFLRYFKSREKSGFIFQILNLLVTLTVKDNIVFPLALAKHNGLKQLIARIQTFKAA